MDPRWRDQDGEFCQELLAGQNELVLACHSALHPISIATVVVTREAAEGERAPRAIPTEPLDACAIVLVQVHPAMQREAVEECFVSTLRAFAIDVFATSFMYRLAREKRHDVVRDIVSASIEMLRRAPKYSPDDTLKQRFDVVASRWSQSNERGALIVVKHVEDTVGPDGVKVDVQVERAAESLAIVARGISALWVREPPAQISVDRLGRFLTAAPYDVVKSSWLTARHLK